MLFHGNIPSFSLLGLVRMFRPLISVLFASAVTAGVLPSGRRDTGDANNTLFHIFERGLFGPIATDSAAGIAGGEVACGSPPVSSFFAGLNPPVCVFPF